jgi:hypothetical protein
MDIVESLQSHCIHTQFHWSSAVVHPFASRHEGPWFNPQGGTYSVRKKKRAVAEK